MNKIGFGGGCHWCTEAVFQAVKGVVKVEQGWVASSGKDSSFSEAVIVHFDKSIIDLKSLISIHLYTHSSTSQHSMRNKYRSAIYVYSKKDELSSKATLEILQTEFDKPLITKVLPFVSFRENKEKYQNYYQKNAGNRFCERYISPKLQFLMSRFPKYSDSTQKK